MPSYRAFLAGPWVSRRPARFGRLLASGLIATLPALTTCSAPLDLCSPQTANYAFFSKGDCVFTRSSTFQGHEWLTVLGNRRLDATHRFTEEESAKIAEGNRRVDWPKEVLVNMNAGVVSYMSALTRYTNEPARQVDHFLLTDRNTQEEALAGAQDRLRALTAEAVRYATSDPERAYVAIGRANHLIQDSYSNAHSRRDVDHPTTPACVLKIKAYIARAPGFATPDIEYHGDPERTDDDDHDDDDESESAGDESLLVEGIGHTTTQDSIYREGRDCRAPETAAGVEACLSDSAKRARDASADYLAMVGDLQRSMAGADLAAPSAGREALERFVAKHFSRCP